MQDASPIPHGLSDLLWYGLVTILASIFGGGTFAVILSAFLNRNKTKSEIHETDARSLKLMAEVRSIDTSTSINASDAVLRMVNELAFAESQKRSCEADRERLENENEAYERQIRWAKATFKVKGIPWDDSPP